MCDTDLDDIIVEAAQDVVRQVDEATRFIMDHAAREAAIAVASAFAVFATEIQKAVDNKRTELMFSKGDSND